MSTGADNKTMPLTAEYEDGFERTFGKDRKPQRGRWVQHPKTGQLIPAEEYVGDQTDEARNAPIMVDRFMEGASTQDGVDIGSRKKRRDYMKATGSVDTSDASPEFFRKRRQEKEAQVSERTRQTVAEIANTDTRHLRKAVDEMRRKR